VGGLRGMGTFRLRWKIECQEGTRKQTFMVGTLNAYN
jgi:hypothetical protein